MWIDLSHNRLTELSPDLGLLKNLKTLYLHANYISVFNELLHVKNAEQLRTLTIHANPL
jgi:Leucine-rich repeat (LRR) protein